VKRVLGSINSPDDAAAFSQSAQDDDNSLKTLSGATGGRAFTRLSDPLRAVQSIMVDNGSYYLLGFYPNPFVNDGKFHDVTVKVKRRGLRVRARAGYTSGDDKRPRPSTATRDMTASLGAGIDDPSLPIRAVIAPIADAPDGTRAVVSIEVSYPRPEDARRALDDELRMGVLAVTPDAKIKSSFQRPSTFKGTWQPEARGVLVLDDVIDLPRKPLSLRIGVTSRALAKTGTTHITVSVPDFRHNDLQLSSLILGSSRTAADVISGFDFIRSLVPFQPTTSRTFARTDTLRVFAKAFWKSQDEAVTAAVTLNGDSPGVAKAFTLPGTLEKDGHRRATLDTTLSLNDLSPGSYLLRVDVHSPKQKPAVREIPIEVK
jgi:hypothetical protein